MGAFALFLGVAVAHYGYYAWPPGWERSWAQWVALNALIVFLTLSALPVARRSKFATMGAAACWWAAIESGQAVVCSVVGWGSVPKADVCVENFGPWPYVMCASACTVWLIVKGSPKK